MKPETNAIKVSIIQIANSVKETVLFFYYWLAKGISGMRSYAKEGVKLWFQAKRPAYRQIWNDNTESCNDLFQHRMIMQLHMQSRSTIQIIFCSFSNHTGSSPLIVRSIQQSRHLQCWYFSYFSSDAVFLERLSHPEQGNDAADRKKKRNTGFLPKCRL